MASAAAPARLSPFSASANASPTAIPSGMLCSVMAVISRDRSCRWRRINPSIPARKAVPASIPAAAGTHPGRTPPAFTCSMAGISRLQTEAAVMTPAANPSTAFWNHTSAIPEPINTVAAPNTVIRNVKPVPAAAHPSDCSISIPPFFRFGRKSTRMTPYAPRLPKVSPCFLGPHMIFFQM